jgi:tRNA U34 5-methylaminomethyl-2-thiouridine-forming methyltransferase MnmC
MKEEISRISKKTITGDKSVTFFSEKFQEFYHSKSGAIDEAFRKYAIPSKICSVEKKEIAILDICFGVGYNTLAGLAEAMKNPFIKKIFVAGLEIDPEIVSRTGNASKEIDTAFKGKRIHMQLIMDDALKSIKILGGRKLLFDFVFLDPFSPKKCPELWTLGFFRDINRVMNKKGVLTTYSCARVVRDNLINSGFIVKDGPKVMRRGPSTIAVKEKPV